jgi:hypothetical protein
MRGYQARGVSAATAVEAGAPQAVAAASTGGEGEMVTLLAGIRDELRRTRELLEGRSSGARSPQSQPPRLEPPAHV